jgi:hypothetical protein
MDGSRPVPSKTPFVGVEPISPGSFYLSLLGVFLPTSPVQ